MIILAFPLVMLLAASLYVNYMFLNNIVDPRSKISLGPKQQSQSSNYEAMKEYDQGFRGDDEEESVTVAIMEGKAYWVGDEGLLYAPLNENGAIIYTKRQNVDVHSLTEDEVSTLMSILDVLNEGEEVDEGSGSGE